MRRHVFLLTTLLLCLNGCGSSSFTGTTRRSYHPPAANANMAEIPEGTTFEVMLNSTLDSGAKDKLGSREGELFTAKVVAGAIGLDGRTAIPAGTIVKGRVEDIKHVINRTSMSLSFYELVLSDGRRVPIMASPKPGSRVDFDELKDGGTKMTKDFLIEKGIDAITAGVFAPIWLAKKAMKGYEFVTKEERMLLPKGSIIKIRLDAPAYIPR